MSKLAISLKKKYDFIMADPEAYSTAQKTCCSTDCKLIQRGAYLDADHFLRDVHHGIGQPALQALGKVADGLS